MITHNSPWLRAAIEDRLAGLPMDVVPAEQYPVLVTTLTDPPEDTDAAVELWERTCDRCGCYVPPGGDFLTVECRMDSGSIFISIILGLCEPCSRED